MTRRIHHFGQCRLDVAARKLLRAGEYVNVSPTIFDCIAYLLEHRERAVGRDELVAAVWGKTGVTDSVLGKTLLKMRRAVGDNGDEQNVIRTVPRFGFHWVAEVRIEDVSGEPAVVELGIDPVRAATPVEPQPQPRRPRRMTGAMAGLALLALLAVATVAGYRRFVGADADSATPQGDAMSSASAAVGRLAMLPVAVSAGSSDAWLRLGLMDLIAHHLRDGGVAMVPSESVVRLVNEQGVVDAVALRAATGARSLVASSLRKIDAVWLLRVEMTDATGQRREAEARGEDPIVIARDAANQLLVLLGRPVLVDNGAVLDLSLTELSQRIEASMLAGDVETAAHLLEAASPDQQALPELRLRSAQIDYRAGRTEVAYRKLTALRTELGVQSDPVLRARILSNLGNSARLLGDYSAAESAFAAAIALLAGRHEPVTLGQIHVGRSISYIEQGRFAEASDDFSLARTVFQSIDDQFELAMAEYCEGVMETRRNRPLSALPIFERVAERFERFGALNELANARSNQTLTQYNLLRHADAIATSERSQPLLGHLQNLIARHQLQYARAMSLAAVGRLTEARTAYAELASQLDPQHEPRITAMIRVRQADIELLAGDAKTAYAISEQVSAMPARPDTTLIRASGWLTVVQALVAMGRADETAAQVAQFSAWAAATKNPIAVFYAWLAEAEDAQAGGRQEAALSLYANAMRSVEREGVPADVGLVAVSYARALIAAGDLVRAGAVAGRITRYAEQDFPCAMLLVELYHAMGNVDAWRTSLDRARALAGERLIPPRLTVPPRPVGLAAAAL